MKDDASTQSQPGPATLPEQSSGKATPFEAAKSRVTGFLTSFIRKKKTTPEKPPATQDGPVRPDLFLDSKGKIVAAHPRCAGFFGRQMDELGGLNIKDLLKPGSDQVITNILAKGKEANELSFHVLAVRKDGSEFATKFSFRFLKDFRFRWAVFVQESAGSNGAADQPSREPKAIVPTTETATTESPDPASDENKGIKFQEATRQHPEAENRNLTQSDAKARAELDKEREAIKVSRKKEEVFQTQVQTLQGALEQAEARAHESSPQSKDWEKRAANLKKVVDELTRRHAAEQNAAVKAAQRVKELEEQLKRAGHDRAADKKDIGDQGDTRIRLKMENRNLESIKQSFEELTLKHAAEQDAAAKAAQRVKELEEQLKRAADDPAAGKKDFEDQGDTRIRLKMENRDLTEANAKAKAELDKERQAIKKRVDELTRRHAAEQNAAVKAAQRVKELEEQLKRAKDDQAAAKKESEGQEAARQRPKAENRNLPKAKAVLDKDPEAIKGSRKNEEELQAQVQTLQGALEKAEASARESVAQSRDWEKQAAHFQKSVDDLTKIHAAEQSASAERVKELEQQLKHGGGNQSAANKDVDDQDDTRHFLKAENSDLTKAHEKAKANLDKERETFKKCVDELTRKHAAEQSAAVKAAQRVKELEERLKHPGVDQAAGKKDIEGQEDTRHFLKSENRNLTEANAQARAELDKEREAIKVARKKEEELQTQLQELQGAFEKSEARARESVAQSKDLEKETAVFKKSVDELAKSHAAEQSAAEQRVKELEQQLKHGGGNQSAANKDIDDQDDTRHFLKLENRDLTKAHEKAKADLAKERETFKKFVDELTRKLAAEQNAAAKAAQRVKELEEQLKRNGDGSAAVKKDVESRDATHQRPEAENRNLAGEELQAQVQKLQVALEQAEARARESAAQCQDWETQATHFQKSVDDLTKIHAAEQSAAEQRVKELEEQLKRKGDDPAAGNKASDDQEAELQFLERENRKLTEASAKAKAGLDKEREAFKKCIDELTRKHAAEQNAAVKAAQRVKELEEQLKHAGNNQAGNKDLTDQEATRQRLEAENRNLAEANAKAKADLDKEREAITVSRKKEEELQAQVQTLQGTLEQTEARSRESATHSKDWEKKAADLKKSIEDLTHKHAAEQNAAVKSAQRVKELEEQLKRAGDDHVAGKKAIEDQDATRQRLQAENRNLTEANAKAKAELDKEREAIKVSRKKEEELQAQLQKLQGAFEKAEARSGESSEQSRDWEKKAADLKKAVDDLTHKHAAEQNSAVKAAQRVTELEEQLKRAGDDQAVRKKAIEDQDTTHQRLEAENRKLTEASAKAKTDLEKEREAIKVSRKNEEELQSQIQKLQGTLEQAEARARESARQSRDREKEAADLKKSIRELTESHADEQSAAEKRVWKLEEQLKRAGDDLAASKAEHSDLTEAAETHAALEKKAAELEERVRKNALSLAKADAELERQRAERERAEKSALSAAAQIDALQEKLRRQADFERASLSKIADLEKTIVDRGDDLARAYAALRIEVKERQAAEKQSRFGSESGNRPESNQPSFEDPKKEPSSNEAEQLEVVQCSLEKADSDFEDDSSERHRVDELLSEARQQREKLAAEIFLKASRMFSDGRYSECYELTKELMLLLDEKIPIFNNAWNLHIHTLTNLRRWEEAKSTVQHRVKTIEDRLGKKHPSLMSPLKNLAEILDRTGFVFEADQAMRRISSIAEKNPSVDDVEFGTYLNNLSRRSGTKRA